MRMKARGMKGPMMSGPSPKSVETPTPKGSSRGPRKPKVAPMGKSGRPMNFVERMGVKTDSDKTVGYF